MDIIIRRSIITLSGVNNSDYALKVLKALNSCWTKIRRKCVIACACWEGAEACNEHYIMRYVRRDVYLPGTYLCLLPLNSNIIKFYFADMCVEPEDGSFVSHRIRDENHDRGAMIPRPIGSHSCIVFASFLAKYKQMYTIMNFTCICN